MINTERIVPVTAVDLISLYGLILKQDSNNSTLAKLAATNPGEFSVTSGSAPLLCAEPMKALDIASAVSAATVYFVAAYDYKGITKNSAAITQTGDVEHDAATLYKAVLSSGSITITKVGY